VRIFGIASGRGPEAECAPWEPAGWSLRARYFLLLRFPVRVWGRGAPSKGAVGAGRVVVAAAGGVAEGIVGIIYLLEFLGSGKAFRRVGGDAVGVVFECCSAIGSEGWWGTGREGDVLFVGISDLLLACFDVDLQRRV
jgi:hypothetical protein